MKARVMKMGLAVAMIAVFVEALAAAAKWS